MRKFISIMYILVCSCKNESASVPFSKVDTVHSHNISSKVYKVSGPMAVEAFFYRDFLLTANTQDTTIDSAEMFIENNRQRYYDIMDFYGYYVAVGKHLLDSLNVQTVTTVKNYTAIQFITDITNYTVDLNRYKTRSGIFLFNGKDYPVFWESANKDRPWSNSLGEYFK